jgi:hypothetical protein
MVVERVVPDVEDVLPKEEPIRAWAGDRDDLVQLGDVMDELFVQEREQALEQVRAELSQLSTRNILGRETKASKERSAQREHQAINSWQVKLEAKDHQGRARKGDCRHLLEKVDFEETSGLTFSCSVRNRNCSVTLANGGSQNSSLKVSGDPQWALSALSNLREQLNKQRPGWSFLRNGWVGLFLYSVFMISAFFAWFSASDWVDSNYSSEAMWWAAFIGIPIAFIGIFTFGTIIYSKTFPAFEIREPGRTSRRRRVAQTIGGIVGALVVLLTIVQGVITISDRINSP